MKAFVAGATGLTGRFVVESLRNQGIETHAHIRPDSPRLEEWCKRFEAQGARPDTTPWIAEAMMQRFEQEPVDLVFGVLGTTKKRQKTIGGGDYMAVDHGLTAMLIDAQGTNPAPRFIYLSSLGSKKGVRSAYMKARWLTEEHLRESGLPHLIARPSFILGERDTPRAMEGIGGFLVDGLLGVAKKLGASQWPDQVCSIQGQDLGRGLVHFALHWSDEHRIVYTDELQRAAGQFA